MGTLSPHARAHESTARLSTCTLHTALHSTANNTASSLAWPAEAQYVQRWGRLKIDSSMSISTDDGARFLTRPCLTMKDPPSVSESKGPSLTDNHGTRKEVWTIKAIPTSARLFARPDLTGRRGRTGTRSLAGSRRGDPRSPRNHRNALSSLSSPTADGKRPRRSGRGAWEPWTATAWASGTRRGRKRKRRDGQQERAIMTRIDVLQAACCCCCRPWLLAWRRVGCRPI